MKLINHEQIVNLGIPPHQCYEWVEEMLKYKAEAVLPPKISMKQKNHIFYNIMPCILPDNDIAGVKVVNRYPNRIPSLDSQIMLYNLKTGRLKAVLDGNYITSMRTGAVAAYSVQLLALKKLKTIGLIGLGNTARATFKVLMDINTERNFVVKLFSYKNHADLFINDFKNHDNLTFEICTTYEEVVNNSDVVISCVTFAENNFCADKYYKEGCLVVPIHTLGFQNCDLFFDKVYADDIEHVRGFKYFNYFKRFAEVSDVIAGQAEGRTNDKERIIVYNIGIAVHDIFFAEKIYQLMDSVAETDVKFDTPEQKFWL